MGGGLEGEEGQERFLLRLRQRDERAFNELVRLYERRVFRLVTRLLPGGQDAEDVTQEVFVQVFKAIEQFRGDAKLSTWIFRIAVNLSKNRTGYLARRHTDVQDQLEAVGEYVSFAGAPGVTSSEVTRPDDAYDGHEVERILQRSLQQLETDFREVLVLRDIEDLSYEEIGAITGLAEGTVKSRLHRARAQLKTLVETALGEKIR